MATTDTAVAEPSVPPSPMPAKAGRRWRFPVLPFVAGLLIVTGTGVFLYPQTAAWFAQAEQARVIALGLNDWDQPPNEDAAYRAEQLELARRYNEALASGATVGANANVPTGSGQQADPALDYNGLLAASDTGLMARLRYEALDIDLPVYHGTSDETLDVGVGHLEGTSLPVGGVGTRAVLTAHRGLAHATMFNNLDKAAVGETLVIEVLGEVLSYRVTEIKVIAPEDTEELFAVPTKDLVTLVTCTPLGINSHRIIVTAERITPTPKEDIAAAGQTSDLPGFPWWAVIGGGVLVVVVGYVWLSGYPPRSRRTGNAAG